MTDYVCINCGKPCATKLMDCGYGRYEYFGAVGSHVSMQEVSTCCETDIMEIEDDDEDDTSEEASQETCQENR